MRLWLVLLCRDFCESSRPRNPSKCMGPQPQGWYCRVQLFFPFRYSVWNSVLEHVSHDWNGYLKERPTLTENLLIIWLSILGSCGLGCSSSILKPLYFFWDDLNLSAGSVIGLVWQQSCWEILLWTLGIDWFPKRNNHSKSIFYFLVNFWTATHAELTNSMTYGHIGAATHRKRSKQCAQVHSAPCFITDPSFYKIPTLITQNPWVSNTTKLVSNERKLP